MRTELTDFQIEYRDIPPISVKVPCSLVSALAAIGEMPTPRAAGDEERISEATAYGATFCATLTADALMLSQRYVFLRFHGLFAPAEIGIDGRTVASVSDLRAVTTVEIRNYLTEGEHRLTVTFPVGVRDTAARARPFFDDVGIFRPVECITTDEAAIENVGVYAETRGEDTFFRVRAELLGEGRGTRAVATVESPSGQFFYAGLPDFSGEVNIRHATLWYPAGVGEAACYHLTVTLYRDAEVIDAMRLSVGVRALAPSAGDSDDPFAFSSDGVRFIPRGTSYLPTSAILARETAVGIRNRTEAAAAAGVNAFFVPDAGVFLPDAFYDSCDRLGIAVFQELSADSADDAVTVMHDLIARTAHHPSLLCYYTMSEALAEVFDARVKEYDPTLCCRYAAALPLAAFPSLPAMSTLRTYLPADGWNYLSDAMISSEEHAGDLMKILNAAGLSYPYANGMEKLVYLSGILQSDRLREEIFERRAAEGATPPLMFGSFADAKTRTSTSLVDSTGQKKAAWYVFRRATAPVVLIPRIENDTLTVTLSNISATPFRGTMTCRLSDAHNRVQKEFTESVAARPVSHATVFSADLAPLVRGHEREFYLAFTLSDGQNVVFSDTALFVPPRSFRFSYPDITYEIKGSGRDFVLTVCASAFAKYVKFDFQNTDVEWSDNYIDFVKDAPVRIPFTTRSNAAAETLIRDFSYRSVYDLFRDETVVGKSERLSQDTLFDE